MRLRTESHCLGPKMKHLEHLGDATKAGGGNLHRGQGATAWGREEGGDERVPDPEINLCQISLLIVPNIEIKLMAFVSIAGFEWRNKSSQTPLLSPFMSEVELQSTL